MVSRDVSKEAVVVLLLLTVVVALVGTISVTQTASNIKIIDFDELEDSSVKTSGFVVKGEFVPPVGRASIQFNNPGDETQ